MPVALALALLSWLVSAAPAAAQYSPNCRLNGRPAACAITPIAEAASGAQTVEVVVFADHSAYRLERPRQGCQERWPRIVCPLTLIPDNGNGRPLQGTYQGTWREGSYEHDYRAPGVHITTYFLD